MLSVPLPYKKIDSKIIINIKVIPKSSTQRFGDVLTYDNINFWKVYLTSPPEQGKANKELVKLLATKIGISKSLITIPNGKTNQYKTLQIADVSDNFANILKSLIFGS